MADATAELERAAADIPLTRDARSVLERASGLATDRAASQAGPLDVMRAILADRGSSAYNAIRTLASDPQVITMDAAGTDNAESLPLRQLLVNANREAQVLGHYQVDSIHLLLALLYSDSRATSALLQKAGLTLYDLRRHLQTGVGPDVPVTAGVHSKQDRALRRKPLPSMRGAVSVSPVSFLLLGGIALPGGAVYIDHSALRSRAWDSLVSVAGPAGTLLCALLVAVPFLIPGHAGWVTYSNAGFWAALAFLGFMEVVAVLLNLLPIPGVDGFGILRPWLPYTLQALSVRYSQIAIIGLFVVLWNVAPARAALFGAALQITYTLDIPTIFIVAGQLAMRP